jgi:pyrophosphatase PpaX
MKTPAPADWRAVLFDLDGTLADTVPLILRCYRHTMKAHRGEELPDALWLKTLGKPLRVSMREFAHDDEESQRMLSTYIEFQRQVHDEMVAAFPSALDAVESLRARGVPVGVITSKGREMTTRTLGSCGLEDFDVLVTADDVTRGKPDPEPVLMGLKKLGLQAHAADVLFVGDAVFDIEAGKAAGVRTAAVLWGPFSRADLEGSRPDYWATDFEGLLSLRPSPR